MAKYKEKQRAIELRKQGKSYSQIRGILKVSKSSLSVWLKDFPLAPEQLEKLMGKNEKRIENYIKTCRQRKENILKQVYDQEKINILPLSKRDLFISGLFLYWGEGGKTQEAELSLSNTNPTMIKFFLYWLEKTLNFKRDKIKIKLHLYKNMNVKKEIDFWTKELNVKIEQFIKPYIKNSSSLTITYKNSFKHGTCNILVRNASLAKKTLMGLKVIQDYFNFK